MKYQFKMDISASELFQITMSRTYRSLAGTVNIIITVAMLILAFRFLGTANMFYRVLIIFGCLLFPVFHPLAIYGQSIKQKENMRSDVVLGFDDRGMHVDQGNKHEDIPWTRIPKVIKQNNMVIVMSDKLHGYMLTDRVLGGKKEEFYNYVLNRLSRD